MVSGRRGSVSRQSVRPSFASGGSGPVSQSVPRQTVRPSLASGVSGSSSRTSLASGVSVSSSRTSLADPPKPDSAGSQKAGKPDSAGSQKADSSDDEDSIEGAMKLVDRFKRYLSDRYTDRKAAWEDMDTDNSGEVSFEGLVDFFERNWNADGDDDAEVFDSRRLFNLLDTDGSGFLEEDEIMRISRKDITQKLRELNKKLPAPATKEVLKEVGPHNMVERFRALVLQHFATLKESFVKFDLNGNGDLSYLEVSQGFENNHIRPHDQHGYIDIKKAFKSMDLDGSGEIDVWEFQGLWKPKKKKKKETEEEKGKKDAADRAKERRKTVSVKPKLKKDGTERKTMVATGSFEIGKNAARPAGKSIWMKKIEDVAQSADIKILNIDYGCVGDWGAERLAQALVPASGIARQMDAIHLENNYIGDRGAICLANAIEACCVLKELYLARNGVCDAGATRLSNMACNVPKLQVLGLANNRICQDGAKAFAKAFSKPPAARPKLKTLDLTGNEITPIGIKDLRKATQNLNKLTVILDLNPGLLELAKTAPGGLFGQDPGYKLTAKPTLVNLARRTLPNLQEVARTQLTVDMMLNLTSKCGDQWGPCARLKLHMAFAGQLGLGERPRTDVDRLCSGFSDGSAQRRKSWLKAMRSTGDLSRQSSTTDASGSFNEGRRRSSLLMQVDM